MKIHNKNITNRGYTIIEILLVLSLIAAIAGIGVPIYQRFQITTNLDIASNTLSQYLKKSQALSQSSDGDSTWGVHINDSIITLFKGASYGLRDVNYDEIFDMTDCITSAGEQEIVFAKLSGEILNDAVITLNSCIGKTNIININTKGIVY